MVNIQSFDDNECVKWCLVGYLNTADYHPSRIRKVDKGFARALDFKEITFLSDLEIFIKLQRRATLSLVFLVKKNMQPTCQEIRLKDMFIYYW